MKQKPLLNGSLLVKIGIKSIDEIVGMAGIEILIRNAEEEVMAASTCRIPFPADIEFAEAVAFQKGVNLAVYASLIPGTVESDSQNLVNPINKKKYLAVGKWGGWLTKLSVFFPFRTVSMWVLSQALVIWLPIIWPKLALSNYDEHVCG